MKHVKSISSKPLTEVVAEAEEANALTALAEGVQHEVEDFIRLELTAEQMLQEEAVLVRDYLANNTQTFWADLKGELLYWELIIGVLLLRAANPICPEWRFHARQK